MSGLVQSTKSQRIRHDFTTEQEQQQYWVQMYLQLFFSWINPLIIMWHPRFSLVTIFILKSVFLIYVVLVQLSFYFLLHRISFLMPSFSVYMSLDLKCVSFRQHKCTNVTFVSI